MLSSENVAVRSRVGNPIGDASSNSRCMADKVWNFGRKKAPHWLTICASSMTKAVIKLRFAAYITLDIILGLNNVSGLRTTIFCVPCRIRCLIFLCFGCRESRCEQFYERRICAENVVPYP